MVGWQLPRTPDAVYNVQEEPYQVPGEVAYQWFAVDTDFKEDKWVQSVEVMPGNRAVVHHILAFHRQSRTNRNFGGQRGFFAAYVPGLRARPWPEGTAKLLPAGSQLVFQVHYTPIGSIQEDVSQIGLVFAEPENVTRRGISTSAFNAKISIPSRDDNHREEAKSRVIPWDAELLSMSPHMHLRGKSFHYDVVFPDGRREVLLDVPHYDFNWQTTYRFSESISLPADSQIHVVAHFDNSAGNLNNPNPDRNVSWGDQTWDEMLIGYFNISVPADVEVAQPESELMTPVAAIAAVERQAKKLFQRADGDDDGSITKEEAPAMLKAMFLLVDRDKNGTVSLEEFSTALKKYMKH